MKGEHLNFIKNQLKKDLLILNIDLDILATELKLKLIKKKFLIHIKLLLKEKMYE